MAQTTKLKLSPYKKSSRYKPTWTITDSYLLYKEEVKDSCLDKKTYVECFKEIFWEASKLIIRESKKMQFPYISRIEIRKRRNNRQYDRQKIDFKHYNETNEIVYHTNRHTNKYYFFWDWYTNVRFFRNASLYKFVAARGNDYIIGTRGLAKWIKKCADDPMVKDYDALIK